MGAQPERLSLPGPAGQIEVVREMPAALGTASPKGVAVIAHPHPLFGGTMDNKVVHTLARAFLLSGWTAVRFNFRGVGASSGIHDEGRGETEDMLALVARVVDPGVPLALAGFSFGAFVAAVALNVLWSERPVQKAVLVGLATSRFSVPLVPMEALGRTLVVHGEADDTVPLQSVLDWARPHSLPVTVIPGGGHFFHGQLPLLRDLISRHLRS